MILKVAIGIICTVILFTGCTKIPTTKEREQNALSLVNDKTIVQKNIHTSSFNLFTLQKINPSCKDIKVYIEGDGLAWVTRRRISDDPTPLHPLALSLMNIDKSKCKVYIARPCQYISSNQCSQKYWTSHRFSTKVIESYLEALQQLKEKYKNNSFSLIGYSGGGAIATLVASKRDDVKSLVTIAGNLDHKKWTDIHRISPLSGSLNPANYSKKLQDIEQYHLIGRNDVIMPIEIFLSYKSHFANTENIHSKMYDASHTKNWEQNYKNFLKGHNGQ